MMSLLSRAAASEPLVDLLATPRHEPVLQLQGPGELPPEVRERAAILRDELLADGRAVDRQAVVQPGSDWKSDPACLHVHIHDFAEVSALRERAGKVAVLNAMGILVSPDRRALALHRRAASTEFYPCALQGVGGSYAPPDETGSRDGTDLSRTLRREVCEELGLDLSVEPARLLLLRERDVGSFLLVYAGCVVTRGLHDPDVDRDEGDLCMVSFDRLERVLTDPSRKWAPSGRLSVLSWLALDAPGAGSNAIFDGLRPQELLRRILAQ